MSELEQVLGRIERVGESVAVVFDRGYATSPGDLWEACTHPERLARWFAPVSGELRPGGRFTIHFDDADTPTCRVVTCEPPARLVWEWPLGDVATLVTAEVSADGPSARLVLRHERLSAGQAPGYAAGWDTYVRRLEADLAGDPLPDWDATWTALHARYADRV
ncbi:SRPBCC family protein [Terrabacter carboxydivorans]|uniref:Activator of Hsp90 ATPase homologue 1/2-like C-terminal domain-containing protein n=1 Tax=Terrabacter carboxydivorans TaxID=619730 RepID=A0ABP5ZBX2_9MICO